MLQKLANFCKLAKVCKRLEKCAKSLANFWH